MYAEASPDQIERARGNREAFAELYDLYVRRVYSFCLSRCGDAHVAEDLTAQTFERALHAIGRYQDRGRPLSSWLLTIAARLMVDEARGRARFVHREGGSEDTVSTDMSPEMHVEEWERDAEMRSVISMLPQDQQKALQLRYWYQQSVAEVALEMGRNENAAKQLLHRAVRNLRVRLEDVTANG